MVKRVLGIGVILAAATAMSGCLLVLTLGVEEAQSLSEEIQLITDAISTQATTAVCQTDPFFSQGFRRCTYFIDGVEVASSASLVSELGVTGVFLDPIVLELPAGVTNIAGTYDDGAGHRGPLNVYPALSFVPVDDTHTLKPGPGKQLAIIDLPTDAPVAGVTYQFGLTFQQLAPKGTSPTQLKALMTGKLTQNGKTFYPPMLPCVNDFAAVSSITIPRSASLEPLALPAAAGCSNKFFGYFRNEVGPSMACDLDNDHDIDRNDVALVMAVRNRTASPGDPRDINADSFINANDARACTLQCTRAQCNP